MPSWLHPLFRHGSYKKASISLLLIIALSLWAGWGNSWLWNAPFLLFLFMIVTFVPWKRFYHKSYRKALLPLAGIIAVVWVLESFGWFNRLEGAFLDVFMRGQTPMALTPIFIVEIQEKDYKKFFKESSPLDASVVLTLIRSIERGEPSVIGVDLDTRNQNWRSLWDTNQRDLNNRNIVWAEVPYEITKSKGQEPELMLDCVLGGKLSNVAQMGIVRFPQDVDGVVRRLRATYEAAGTLPDQCLNGETGPIKKDTRPAFYRAVRQIYEGSHSPAENHPAQDEIFRFSRDQNSFTIVRASEFLTCADKDLRRPERFVDEAKEELRECKIVEPNPNPSGGVMQVNKQIVLVGGEFRSRS